QRLVVALHQAAYFVCQNPHPPRAGGVQVGRSAAQLRFEPVQARLRSLAGRLPPALARAVPLGLSPQVLGLGRAEPPARRLDFFRPAFWSFAVTRTMPLWSISKHTSTRGAPAGPGRIPSRSSWARCRFPPPGEADWRTRTLTPR